MTLFRQQGKAFKKCWPLLILHMGLSACTIPVAEQVYDGATRPSSKIGEVNVCSDVTEAEIWAVDDKRMVLPVAFGKRRLCIVHLEPGYRRFVLRYMIGTLNGGYRGWGLIGFNVQRGHKYKIKAFQNEYIWAVDVKSGEVVAGVPHPRWRK